MSDKRLAVLFLDTLYSYSLITFKTPSIALFKTSSLQGSENAKKFLADNPAIFDEIDRKIRIHYGLIEADEEQEVVEAEENTIAVEDIQDVVLDLDGGIELED
jgi:hypothetical protein